MSQTTPNYHIIIKFRKVKQKIFTDCSLNLRNMIYWPQLNIQDSNYRKPLNFKPSRNSITFISIESLTKASKLLKCLRC